MRRCARARMGRGQAGDGQASPRFAAFCNFLITRFGRDLEPPLLLT
jgi:hypothetical protein